MTEYREIWGHRDRMYYELRIKLMILIEKNEKIHGYELSKQLASTYTSFIKEFPYFSGMLVYGSLHRLRDDGLIEPTYEIKGKKQLRVLYNLTERGKDWLRRTRNQRLLDALRILKNQ
ncbi:MAG: hypothetical protein G01um101433_545 [Parcubacteria group bacterium Gr01-1014_33]|nr:MAG: hypothetical protein G01um101433_545 [Parcubacteria group bacterium Gr01-1014_33]